MRASGWLLVGFAFGACSRQSTAEADGGPGANGAAARSLTIRIDGSGEVQSVAPSFVCRTDCRQDVQGTVVLTASGDQTGTFSGWQGDCTGTGPCTLAMDTDRTVTAVFAAAPPPALRFSVQLTGSGSGRVVSTPAAIDCPGTCSGTIAAGSPISLHAQPGSRSTFAGWSGGCSGTGDCTPAGDVRAEFDLAPAAQCAGLIPAPAANPVTATVSTTGRCAVGMGDDSGTIGLQTMGSPHGVTLHFVDEQTGAERGVTSNYDAMDGSFTQQPNGFTAAIKSPTVDSWSVHYWNKDGIYVAASNETMNGGPVSFKPIPGGGIFLAGLRAITGLPPAPTQSVNRFDMNATRRWSGAMQSLGNVVGSGVDVNGAILVFTVGGPGTILGQWMDDRGVETGSFVVVDHFTAGPDTWFETGPLIGGGVAVRRVDEQNDADGRPYRTSEWLKMVPANQAVPNDPPAWLVQRPNTNLAIARSGTAYAVLPMGEPGADCMQRIEILAPDGTSCGSFDAAIAAGQCRTEDMGLGLDDTPIQLMPAAQAPAGSCSWRWWPRAIH